ncbi:DUF7520 family protein [Halobaculum sp. EA56]|uniref:DUF7520 family protein n=1 Tax=Halobaculum sp. EA56 TaxID=3421648 RepID=UPI003EC0034D
MSDRGAAVDDGEGAGAGSGGGADTAVEGEDGTVEASGRPYLLGAAAVVTLFAAAAGYVVAANNAVDAVRMFGVVTVPGSPAAVAAYGALLSLLLLGGLFGLVTVASRFDDDAVN